MLGGLRWAFWIGAGLAVVVVVLALRLPGRLPTPTAQPEPVEDLAA
jgi:hypothetical protein